MYSSKPSYVFGFHGLDKDVAFNILTQNEEFRHIYHHSFLYFYDKNQRSQKESLDYANFEED